MLGDGPHGPGEAVSLDIIDTRRLTKLGLSTANAASLGGA